MIPSANLGCGGKQKISTIRNQTLIICCAQSSSSSIQSTHMTKRNNAQFFFHFLENFPGRNFNFHNILHCIMFFLFSCFDISLCWGIVIIRTKLLSNMVLFAAFVTASFHPQPSASNIISAVSYCLLTTEAWFNPRPVRVGFVVDRVAMRQVFL